MPRRSAASPPDDEVPHDGGFVDLFDSVANSWSGPVPETDRDVFVVFGLIETLSRAVRDMYTAALAPFGLNHAEWWALGRLRTTAPEVKRTPTDLRRLLRQTSAGTTRVLDKLEREGLIRREPHPDDGRGTHVVLTAKGRRVADRSFRAVHKMQNEMLSGLSLRERKAAETSMQQLIDAILTRPESG
jgi:DNA-binding MarR family transcriptional regulator